LELTAAVGKTGIRVKQQVASHTLRRAS
jgi:hypothetical protein